MLNRIILFNSAGYGRGEMLLDKGSDSIEIVGPNNVGKTSFISSLLYLYIVDRRIMTFEKEHRSDESLSHYFPITGKSYIVFEGFDENVGYGFFLLVRNKDVLEYYFCRQEFKDEYLMDAKRLMEFSEVKRNPELELTHIRGNKEILNVVYQKNAREFGFFRLPKNIHSVTEIRNVMNFMFNLPKVDDEVIKQGILLSLGYTDNSEARADFGKTEGGEKLEEYRRFARDIQATKHAKQRYESLRFEYERKVNEGIYLKTFALTSQNYYVVALEDEKKKLEIVNNSLMMNAEAKESLKQEHAAINKRMNSLNVSIGIAQNEITQKEEDIQRITGYSDISWIRDELLRLQREKDELSPFISKMSADGVSIVGIKQAIIRLTKKIEDNTKLLSRLESGESLVSHLSPPRFSGFVEEVLSKRVQSLDAICVISKMDEDVDISAFPFGGGMVNLSELHKSEGMDIESIKEEIKEDSISLENKRKEEEVFLELEKKKEHLIELEAGISRCKKEIEEINSLEGLRARTLELCKSIEASKISLAEEEKISKGVEEKQSSLEKTAADLNEKRSKHLEFIAEINGSDENKKSGILKYVSNIISSVVENADETLRINENNLSGNVSADYNEINTKYILYKANSEVLQVSFTTLKKEFMTEDGGRMHEISEFLEWFEEKIYGLTEKEEKAEEFLKSISNMFSSQAKTLMGAYEATQSYISNKFNTTLSNYQISNLSKVYLRFKPREYIVSEMMALQSLNKEDLMAYLGDTKDDTDASAIIKRHINEHSVVKVEDLFDLQIEVLSEDGRLITSDQSNGTMKMIQAGMGWSNNFIEVRRVG